MTGSRRYESLVVPVFVLFSAICLLPRTSVCFPSVVFLPGIESSADCVVQRSRRTVFACTLV